MSRRVVRATMTLATVAGAGWAILNRTRVGDSLTDVAHHVRREARYARAAAPGLRYRLEHRAPSNDVDDATLADRVRSSLGPIEKALDIPRVHILVEHRVVRIDGDVDDWRSARRIERAVRSVSGVAEIESHLHLGLLPGDTRPSDGGPAMPSVQYQTLARAARNAGALDEHRAFRAVLKCFLARIPSGERAHVLNHLGADVRTAIGSSFSSDEPAHAANTQEDFAAAVSKHVTGELQTVSAIIRAVLIALRESVPEEVGDVAATLPAELRELWLSPVTTGTSA